MDSEAKNKTTDASTDPEHALISELISLLPHTHTASDSALLITESRSTERSTDVTDDTTGELTTVSPQTNTSNKPRLEKKKVVAEDDEEHSSIAKCVSVLAEHRATTNIQHVETNMTFSSMTDNKKKERDVTDDEEHSDIARCTSLLSEHRLASTVGTARTSSRSSFDDDMETIESFYETQKKLFLKLQQKNMDLRRTIIEMKSGSTQSLSGISSSAFSTLSNDNDNRLTPTNNRDNIPPTTSNMDNQQQDTGITGGELNVTLGEVAKNEEGRNEVNGGRPDLDKDDNESGSGRDAVDERVKDDVGDQKIEVNRGQEVEGEVSEGENVVTLTTDVEQLHKHNSDLDPKLTMLQEKRDQLTRQLEDLLNTIQEESQSSPTSPTLHVH